MSAIEDIKRNARQALHDAASASVTYYDPESEITYPTADQVAAGLVLTARWHSKYAALEQAASEGAFVLEGVNRLVFNQPQLDALGIELAHNGIATFTGYDNTQFELDQPEPADGPISRYWSVVLVR